MLEGALIDDEQGDEVLAHFAGDGAEDGLPGGDRVEELVRLLDGDDELLRLVLRLVGGEVLLGLADVEVMDAAGQDVGDQHVAQEAALLAELQDDVHALAEEFHDFENGVLVHLFLQEVELFQAFELAVQGRYGFRVRPHFVGKFLDLLGFLAQQGGQPLAAVLVPDQVGRLHRGGVQVELVRQRGDVFHGDLVVGDFDGEIALHAAPPGRLGINGEDGHLAAEKLLQALDEPRSSTAAGFLRRLPAVLAVHVENEVDGAVFMDQARQHQARQERLAGTRLAENPVAALDEALQVDADRRVHVQGLADVKIARVALVPEDAVDVLLLGLADYGEVNGNSFDEVRFTRLVVGNVVLLRHQEGPQADGAVGRGAVQHLAHEVLRLVRRVGQHLRVGGVEANVGDHAKEAAFLALDDHEPAGANVLHGVPLVQLHFQTVDEGAVDDHADAPSALVPVVHVLAFNPVVSPGFCVGWRKATRSRRR